MNCTCPNTDTMVGNCPVHGDVARLGGTYTPNVRGRQSVMEIYERLHEEWEALGMLSFSGDGAGGWRADLNQDDIKQIRALLHDAVRAIDGTL